MSYKASARRGIAARDLFCCDGLERRNLFAGVTIVTHGQAWDRELSPWVDSMADAIANRVPGGASVVTIELNNDTGSIRASARYRDGSPKASEVASGEVVAVLDWSDLAGGGGPFDLFIADYSTRHVAGWVRDAITSSWLLPDIGALTSLPIHLIGHSRGGSLVCELASLLGEQGIWVNQVTTLDPHPRDWVSGDAELRISSNVAFADNYWQFAGLLSDFSPDGTPISGQSFNVYLPTLDGGYSDPHADVHLWYAGTIDTFGDVDDGSAMLLGSDRATWYEDTEQLGTAAGFNLSRLSGQPLDRGFFPYERESAEIVHFGVHELLGGSGLRTEVLLSQSPWPNLLDVNADAEGGVRAGQWLDVDFTLASVPSNVRVKISIDVDANPLNSNEVAWDTIDIDSARAELSNHEMRLSTTGLTPGTYYITASVTDMGVLHQRYASSYPFTVMAPSEFHIAADRGVSGSADPAGGITISGIDGLNRPLVFERDGGNWKATDLRAATSSPAVFGEVVTWIDPKDGQSYAAAPSLNGLIVYRQGVDGAWTYRNITAAIPGATRLSDKLAAFVSVGGTVMLAGIDESGDFVLYSKSDASQAGWTFRNVTTLDLEPQGLPTPTFASSLVGFVTPWDAWNVAGLDYAGEIQAVWIHPASMEKWSNVNLSVSTGAPRFVGELTVYQTSWNAINLVGTDQSGRVSATWWLPEFGSEWRTSNLTDIIGGPRIQESTLASFVTPWGAMNIAGVAGDGSTVVYWWTPESGAWQIAPLSEVIAGAERMTGRVTGLTTAASELNLIGQSAGGELIRYYWDPANPWRFESVTDAVV
jgi:hypothetical protein